MSDRIADIVRPLGPAVADDVATWIDPNGATLSGRVWLAGRTVRERIDTVLLQGILNGDSPSAIAKQLEPYLSPSWAPKRDANGRLVQDQPKRIVTNMPYGLGAGSYPARRVARTEMTRAFGRATIEAARRNPAVDNIRWRLSGNHPHADGCDANAQGGPYAIDDVPPYPAHPQCRCVLVPVVRESTAALVARLKRQPGGS